MQKTIDGLIAAMEQMPVIDSHEHLPDERSLNAEQADVFNRIYCHYSVTSAVSAGFPGDIQALKDTTVSLEERWRRFRPYLDAIRHTGYARSAQITAREIYGIDQINGATYQELSGKLQAANKPGLYDHILRERCRIERVLNQGPWHGGKGGYAVSVSRDFGGLDRQPAEVMKARYEEVERARGGRFDNLTELVTFWLAHLVETGHVGLKFAAHMTVEPVDDAVAEGLFKQFNVAPLNDEASRVLGTWIMHKAIELAPEYGLTVAVHCGLAAACWGDFAPLTPMNVIPFLMRYRDTVFDLYHGGIPWVRETAVIGNQYPNANLNLVWTHRISPYMTEHVLNEWIDLVPTNKIIGFGGDLSVPEKVYGVLKMTQENIARALAVRLSRGQMSETQAVEICRNWLYDNPKRIYPLLSSG